MFVRQRQHMHDWRPLKTIYKNTYIIIYYYLLLINTLVEYVYLKYFCFFHRIIVLNYLSFSPLTYYYKEQCSLLITPIV